MRFDPQKRRYINNRGRVVPVSQVRKQVDEYVNQEVSKTQQEAKKVVAGLMTAAAFFALMRHKIEAWHKVTGVIAYGGRAQMDPERWARIDAIIAREQEFLARFQDEIQMAAEIPDGIVNRAGMYPNAAYSTYENQVLRREADAGVTLARRICESDGASCDECVSAATDQFIPLDEIADIGSLQCLNNCRCQIEFSTDGVQFRTADVFTGAPVSVSAGVQ